MKQHDAAKRAYPDAVIFFRLGDFYEMFFEDAETAARVLGLTLTTRNRNDPDPVPLAGVPLHPGGPATGARARVRRAARHPPRMSPTTAEPTSALTSVLGRIAERAFAQMVHLIWEANNKKDKRPGDPTAAAALRRLERYAASGRVQGQPTWFDRLFGWLRRR